MKKTIITLMALAGCAMGATTTQLLDLSKTITASDELAYLYSNGLITDNSAVDGTVLINKKDGIYIQTSISFTMNLTAAAAAVTGSNMVTLLNVDMTNDIGMYLTETGISVGKTTVDSATSTETTSLYGGQSYTSLFSDAATFTGYDGNQYITLTFGMYGNSSSRDSGVRFASSTQDLTGYNANGFNDNQGAMDGIFVNTDYIAAVQIYNDWAPGGDFKALTSGFNDTTKKLIPEPTTATLSLLALAGLAARRRRASR